MKTFRLFAALMMAVVCVSLSSCSKDNEEFHLESVAGTWYCDYFNSQSYQNAAINLQLNEDGTGYVGYIQHYVNGETIYYAKEEITYSYDGSSFLVINFTEQDYSYNFNIVRFDEGGNGIPIRMFLKEKESGGEFTFERK